MSLPVHLDTAWYALEWAIRIGALLVVPLHRTPSATRAWLLLIFFLPLPGLLFFLLIGSPRFPAWRRARFGELAPYFQATAASLRQHPALLGGQAPVADLVEQLGGMPATAANTVEFIGAYDSVVDRLVQDIDAAQHHVLLLVYIFADDTVGQRVAAALGRAAGRGVVARVMFDPVGSHHWRKGSLRLLRSHGVEVREAMPWRLFRGRLRRDMRNHRKLFVIDGRIGYAGSQNLVAKDFRPGVVNHELVVRVTGPAVTAMEAVIRGDWALETGEMPNAPAAACEPTGTAQAQLLPSGADYPVEGFESLLVWQVHQARRRVVLVTPYFIPDEDLLGALRTAAVRHVEVDIVLSGVVDQKLVHFSQCAYYEGLLAAGARIHLYRGFLLHAG